MARILVADDDPDITGLVKSTLQGYGHQVTDVGNGREVLARATTERPDLVVMDRNMPEMDGIEAVQRLRDRPETAKLPIILLTALADEGSLLEGFQAGIDDYIAKPFNPRELAARVEALLIRTAPAKATTLRRLVTVFSPKGGVGKSTIAVNLAVALANLTKYKVALLDANLPYGDANLLLDVSAERSILNLLPFAGRMDTRAIEATLSTHPSGVTFLARPPQPEYAENITPAVMRELAELMTRMVDITVVDTQVTYDARTLSLFDRADLIVLVATPELGTLRNLREFLAMGEKLGYPRERMLLVLNRSTWRTGVTVADVRGATKLPIGVEIPDGGNDVASRGNMGTPIVLAAPKSEVGRALVKLAQQVADRLGAL